MSKLKTNNSKINTLYILTEERFFAKESIAPKQIERAAAIIILYSGFKEKVSVCAGIQNHNTDGATKPHIFFQSIEYQISIKGHLENSSPLSINVSVIL